MANSNTKSKVKKYKSKSFCVATEGATTDGRKITAEMIQQMADSFDRNVYGARVWLEHFRGIFPDSPFRAYGDVLSLSAREKPDGKLGLYAEIEPTEDLVQINKNRQKIYTSIEIAPDFAGSGKAYLMGLGVTDSPASLGTDILAFTQQNPSGSPLTARKLEAGNIFSVSEETDIELIEIEDRPSVSDRMKDLVSKFRAKNEQTDTDVTALIDAVEQVADHSLYTDKRVESLESDLQRLSQQLTEIAGLKEEFATLLNTIKSSDADTENRPPATGGDGTVQTDY